jgi:hypothetical protein
MSNQVIEHETKPQLPAVSAETEMMMNLIQQIALNPEIPVDKMQAVINMRMQVFDKQAEIEFNKAMIIAQQEMEPITKTAKNQQTGSMYAKMENIAKQCKPIWTKHGFALQFGTADCPIEGHYRVTCEVSHSAGFNKKYQADLPIDDEGIKGQKNKTGCHGFGSTMSYAQRYLTIMIFNITLEGVDNDGNRQPQPQQKPIENQRTPISDSVLAGAIKKIESRERPLSDLLNFHVFTDSQKVIIKKHFPQVQL